MIHVGVANIAITGSMNKSNFHHKRATPEGVKSLIRIVGHTYVDKKYIDNKQRPLFQAALTKPVISRDAIFSSYSTSTRNQKALVHLFY